MEISIKRIVFIVGAIILLVFLSLGSWYFGFERKERNINFGNLFSSKDYSGQWTLNLERTSTHKTVAGTCEGAGKATINFETSKGSKNVAAEGSWNEGGNCSGSDGSTGRSQIAGKIAITGEIKNNQLIFWVEYKEESCQVILNTPVGIYTNKECDPNAIPGPYQITINLAENAEATKTFHQDGEGWSTTANDKWRLTKSCGERLPELKSEIERLLDISITSGEAPDKTHERLINLANQRLPVGKIFKVDNDCLKVAGASIDLMYKIDGYEDTIFKTIGSTQGQVHRIISGSVDKTITKGGRESQFYYSVTIDISLNAD